MTSRTAFMQEKEHFCSLKVSLPFLASFHIGIITNDYVHNLSAFHLAVIGNAENKKPSNAFRFHAPFRFILNLRILFIDLSFVVR